MAKTFRRHAAASQHTNLVKLVVLLSTFLLKNDLIVTFVGRDSKVGIPLGIDDLNLPHIVRLIGGTRTPLVREPNDHTGEMRRLKVGLEPVDEETTTQQERGRTEPAGFPLQLSLVSRFSFRQ